MQLRIYHDSCHEESKGPVGESLKKEGKEERKERKKRKRERKRDFECIFLLSVRATWTKKIARNEGTGGMEKGR